MLNPFVNICISLLCVLATKYFFAWKWDYYLSPFLQCVIAIIALYLPFYFDGSEYSAGHRYSPKAAAFFKTKTLAFLKGLGLRSKALVKNQKAFEGHKQVIFCSHPHGVMSFHHALLYTNVPGAESVIEAIPLHQRRMLAARSLFGIPVFRDFVLSVGAVDASFLVASKCLSQGLSLTVLPGGEHEQLLAERHKHVVYIKGRKGFCKLAVKHNVPIVPAYCFGETSTYETSSFLLAQRKWLAKKFFIAIPLGWGRSMLNPFVPYHTDMVHCIGQPILVPRPDKALDEESDMRRRVELLHAQYMKALRELFDDSKVACGYGSAELVML